MEQLLFRYPMLSSCKNDILSAKDAIIDCYRAGGKLLLCGNGGSCADCEHIAGELLKGFLQKRSLKESQKNAMKENCPALDGEMLDKLQGALPAIPLPSLAALCTAFSNDVDAELVYAQGVMAFGKAGDVLIAISTSGNAKNVLAAAKVAKGLGLKVVALSGHNGGALRALSDVCITVPEKETYKTQELHLPVYHYLCAEAEKHFFASGEAETTSN